MISVTITREELTSRNACADAMGFFEWLVDAQGRHSSVYVREWTVLHSIWLAVVRPGDARWLRYTELIPNLRVLNLSGSDLRGSDLSYSNLSSSNLSGSNLSGSCYPYGDLPTGWARGADGCLTRDAKGGMR